MGVHSETAAILRVPKTVGAGVRVGVTVASASASRSQG